jgi:hypothetical protein
MNLCDFGFYITVHTLSFLLFLLTKIPLDTLFKIDKNQSGLLLETIYLKFSSRFVKPEQSICIEIFDVG